MTSATQTNPVSKGMLWTGRIMSAISSLLVGFAGAIKLIHSPQIIWGFAKMGYPASLVWPVGVTEVSCLIVYLIPRTSVLGAILLTGFLGGATATCLRVGDPSIPLPIVTGMLVWGGLFLRDPRLRSLIPLRSSGTGEY
jgi:hypothetical protein